MTLKTTSYILHLLVVVMLMACRSPKGSVSELAEPLITITEEEIVCHYPSQRKKERIKWEDVKRVQVLTTDEGPFVCDVFFVLDDLNDNGVAIPQDKEESKLVLDRVMDWPDFDHRMLIVAMGSTDNEWFTVWEKK